VFRHETWIRMYDVDAANRLFFGHLFFLAHDATEKFFESLGIGFKEMLGPDSFILPVVHVEGDYHKRVGVGDRLVVELAVEKIGRTSLTLLHRFLASDASLVGKVRIVHVYLENRTCAKAEIPGDLRRRLEAHRGGEAAKEG